MDAICRHWWKILRFNTTKRQKELEMSQNYSRKMKKIYDLEKSIHVKVLTPISLSGELQSLMWVS